MPQTTQFLTTDFELKSFDEAGIFEGYASVFKAVDFGQDMVVPGAFLGSINARGKKGIKLLWQHDPCEPLGTILDLREDSHGLFIKAQLNLEVARAREALSLMRQGVLDGLSIGYKTLQSYRDEKSGVRHLLDVDLWEVSLVTFPMQPEARVSRFKAHNISTIRDYESFLRDAGGFSRSDAKTLAVLGYKGLNLERDAYGYDQLNDWAPLLDTIEEMEIQLKSIRKNDAENRDKSLKN